MFNKNFIRLTIIFILGLFLTSAYLHNSAPVSAATDDSRRNGSDTANVPDSLGQIFLVNSTADEVDANIGDAKCKTASNKCTLRAAIQESNKLLGPNTILLRKGNYQLLIDGDDDTAEAGDLDILDSVTIRGEALFATVVDGKNLDRIFHIPAQSADVQVTIQQLAIGSGEASAGGAIWNGETLTLYQSALSENTALGGGSIYNEKTLHVRQSLFVHNKAGGGGVLYNTSTGVADFVGSTLAENIASSLGGAVYNFGGVVSFVNSTIAKNESNGDGGGIYNDMVAGKMNHMDLRNVTVSQNVADADNSNGGNGGGIFNKSGATVVVFDTIVAQNQDRTVTINPAAFAHYDCAGALTEGDYGYNLLGSPNGCTGLTNGQKGDQVGTINAPLQAKLNDLEPNGNYMPTLMPMSDSPVVDAGDPGKCLNDTKGFDQRRFARVAGANCDLGAVELGSKCKGKPAQPLTFTPFANMRIKKTKVTFKWLAVECGETYQLMVRQDSQNGPIVANPKGIGTNQYTVPGLAKGHTYFWQAKACNKNKCQASVWTAFIIK